jgi:hypothetical protein
MTIEIQQDDNPDRIDAATLPPFSNHSRCPACSLKRYGGLLRYCPGCVRIRGAYFHHECPCGGAWEERVGGAVAGPPHPRDSA